MTQQLTAQEVTTTLREWGGVDDTPEATEWLRSVTAQMNGWLTRGDGIAMYENRDMGHPELGTKRFVSFGSPAAQLETDTPPDMLPDGVGGGVNWRYGLVGTYRGAALTTGAEV